MSAPDERQLVEAKRRFDAIEERVIAACERAGRPREDVIVLGACKRQPVELLLAAHAAGLRHFAENQVQSGERNRELLPGDTTWHFIGPLQSNKVKRAVATFDTFHAVDRLKIARALDRHAGEAARTEPLSYFLEVNLGAEESKHGFLSDDVAEAAAVLDELEHLRLVGLMAIPPIAASESEARRWFTRLRELLPAAHTGRSRPSCLSMGMSGDFEIAIEEGATHVRIGTSMFGPRD